jgi:hypothetical protein
MKLSLLPSLPCTYAQFKNFPIEQAFPSILCEYDLFSVAKFAPIAFSHPSTQLTPAF